MYANFNCLFSHTGLKISELQEAVDTKFEGLIKDEQQIELLLNSPSLQYENCKQFLYRREFNLEQLKTLLTEQREICIRLSKLNLQFECQGLKKLSESAKLLVDKIKTHITQCSTMAENHQRGLHRCKENIVFFKGYEAIVCFDKI